MYNIRKKYEIIFFWLVRKSFYLFDISIGINLFGFATEADKTMFKTLIKISGVGAKLALVILSGQSAEQFQTCIQNNDVTALVKLPGVGKKTAERLVMELRDKLLKSDDAPQLASVGNLGNARAEAISALCSLGYKPLDASRMVSAIQPEGKTCETIIRLALQSAAKWLKKTV